MASRTVDIPEQLAARIMTVAGEDGVQDFVERALEDRLGNLDFVRLLDDLAAEAGPVPDELMHEAEDFWRAG
jgi:hypothetical protein